MLGFRFLLVAILALAATAGAQNWPQFRGPGATGVADGKPLPVKWNAEKGENLLWKTPIPGLALASPVVWDGRVFVTTAISTDPSAKLRAGLYGDVEPHNDQSKHQWKVYAIDGKTGKVLWERLAYEGMPKTKRHPKSSFATGTPATDGQYVVALFGPEGLYCYDFAGKLIWKKDLGALDSGWFYDPDYQWGHGSSPIIYKGMVIVQADVQQNSFLAAYEIKTGKEIWKTQRDEIPSWGTPTVVEAGGKSEIVTVGTKFNRAYDPATGKELWRIGPNSEIAVPTPFLAHGMIFVTNGYRGIQPIYAIRPGGSGDLTLPQGKDSSEFVSWSKKQGGPYLPTPIVYGDHLYVVSNNGVLAVYNAKTGERYYQQRVGPKPGAYTGSVVAGDGKVYFASEDGEIQVLKAGEKYELLSNNPVGEVILTSPAISGGVIYVRGLNHLFAIGEKTAGSGGR